MQNLEIILIYIGLKFGIKRFKKDKLSEIDFKKHKEYYREILKDYSPAELSYIDKFEILPQNDVAATLLSLELKKKICLEEKIKVINNDTDNISSNEKYILDRIEDGKITNFDTNDFILKIQEDAIKNSLLKKSKIEWANFKRVFVFSIFAIALMVCIGTILFNDFINNPTNIEDWKIFILVSSILLITCIPMFLLTYVTIYIRKMKKHSYIRTKKGEILNKNLEGLKNYLKDFSTLGEKDENSLILWEDYLIYSVIFNQNTKTIKNICDKYLII